MISLKSSKKNSILIVAKTANGQSLLLDYLKGFGYKVMSATDGRTALKIAAQTTPDIILLDTILPDIDGFETCRRLKANPATKNVPVIFMTGQTNTVDKVKGFVLGAVDYISKPIQSEEILARLRTHLTLQKLQQKMEAQNKQLHAEIAEREQLISELDAFAHTVAHDLKNPLGVTISRAQYLRKYHSHMTLPEFEDNLDYILKNGLKMNNIIDELLLLSSVRTENVTVEVTDIGEVMDEALERLEFLIEDSRAEIVVNQTDGWPLAMGYGPWIEEVYINYISNAIKYGGEPPRIELGSTILNNGMVQYWVKDNGGGISPEAQVQLFIPFNRLNQVKAKGHGLGLSIVQRIMNRLGGRVSVSSYTGQNSGTTFSFFLPLATEEA